MKIENDSESESQFEPEPEPEPLPEPKVNSEQDILKNYLDIKNLKFCYCCKRYSLSSSFYKGNVEMCVPCIKVTVEKEQESIRIGKKRKTNYHDPNSYCMVCCGIRTHYFSHIANKHNGVDINQVIMDHYLKYPRLSFLGKENIENEDYLIVPFTQSFNENDIFIDTDENTFLQCYECLQFQPLSNYKKNTHKMCKMCLFKKGTLYTETVAARAPTKSKKHFKQGRKGTYSLTKTALEKIFDEYQNRCAITMVEFYKENGKEFCNVEPIIRIMQSSTNWNRAKWLSVKTRREQDFTMDVIYSESFAENVLFSLNLLLNTSHKSTIERNNKKKVIDGKIEKYDHNISIEDLVDLYEKQRGKCKLSGIIMLFNRGKDSDERVFQMSLNRLNNQKGYIKGNIELVCLGFNSIDVSKNQLYSKGQQDWNRTVFDYMMQCLDELSKKIIPTQSYQEYIENN
ncbi:hypothetical protein ACTFIR_004320 [Dictyostelium discoideum]